MRQKKSSRRLRQGNLPEFDLNNLKNKMKEIEENLKTVVSERYNDLEADVIGYTKSNPLKSIGFAALAGAVLSRFLFIRR